MRTHRILIADDDTSLLRALTVRLEAEGFEVATSQDAYYALDQAKHHPPDVLILDVNMPCGSGFSVQERMQKIPELAKTPVVYITGEDPASVDHLADQMGAVSILHKPFETSDLLDAVRAALGYWVVPPIGAS
ncbi:MAG: response regulator [Planctomycetota bacterium]